MLVIFLVQYQLEEGPCRVNKIKKFVRVSSDGFQMLIAGVTGLGSGLVGDWPRGCPNVPCPVSGESGFGLLYSKVQCIMGNCQMQTPLVDTPSSNFFGRQ